MAYVVAKQNLGSARTFETASRFTTALKRAGAITVQIRPSSIYVRWPEGDTTYTVDKEGNVDYQLAWDMEK